MITVTYCKPSDVFFQIDIEHVTKTCRCSSSHVFVLTLQLDFNNITPKRLLLPSLALSVTDILNKKLEFMVLFQLLNLPIN